MEYADLMIENGEIARIEYPEKHIDAFFESIDNARKRRDWWSPSQFEGCKIEYMGISLDRIDMNKVIGML